MKNGSTDVNYTTFNELLEDNASKWIAFGYSAVVNIISSLLLCGLAWYEKYGRDPIKRTLRNSYIYWGALFISFCIFLDLTIFNPAQYATQRQLPYWFCNFKVFLDDIAYLHVSYFYTLNTLFYKH